MKTFLIAASALCAFAMPAVAATLSGTFSVDIYQRTNATSAEARADAANLLAADTVFLETITYTGQIDFGTRNMDDSTTIEDWLNTGVGGSFTPLSSTTAALQLSRPNIRQGSATVTFFDFTATFLSGFDSVIRHDDGITAYDDGVAYATRANPTSVVNTNATGFDGGDWRLLYAATNGDPSILKVTGSDLPDPFIAPVPLPAGLPLLLAGLGGLALLRRRAA
ncbi:VPLPA-CTERM sorting domain-containing protein [Primorskyibacter sp. S187A]|uniref:VPLPA-CTERM sorting domain-containing protein n=1 Tax=Primorskyibacter sp. S187A TaxID=3415130 RepID=UPI003C79FF8C